jgi:glycosyltransferase involved in cell wall biosynthesis
LNNKGTEIVNSKYQTEQERIETYLRKNFNNYILCGNEWWLDLDKNGTPRYILKRLTIPFSGFNFSPALKLSPDGFNLYERKDMKHILFLSYLSVNNAVFYYRFFIPAEQLLKQYIDFSIEIVTDNNYTEEQLQRADIVIFQRHIKGQLELMKRVKLMGKKIVYDTDDLDLLRNPYNPVVRNISDDKINEIKEMLSIADLVTTTTETLRQELLLFNKNVKVLPNRIDFTNANWNLPKDKHDTINVLWAGQGFHFNDLLEYNAGIINAIRQNPNSKLILCGYTPKEVIEYTDENRKVIGHREVNSIQWGAIYKLFEQLGNQLEIRNALSILEYPYFFSIADIIIAPVSDNRFNQAKSPLKILEAGVKSLPIVVSNTKPYHIIEHGIDGYIASSSSKFGKYLSRLIKNKELRLSMGNKLHDKVIKNYSSEQQSDRYNVYNKLLKAGNKCQS